jgi:hypothetical protein
MKKMNVTFLFIVLLVSGIIISCGGGKPLNIEMDSGQDGTNSISGQITLPSEIKAGSTAGLGIFKRGGEGTPWSKMKGALKTTGSNEVNFTISNVPDGEYLIQFQVITGESEKYNGYFGGTVDSPVLDDMSATKVNIAGSSQADINFGIGK